VVPLFKKDCSDKPGNYKPMNLTSVVRKLLEKLLKETIYLHLERQGFISDSQRGLSEGGGHA